MKSRIQDEKMFYSELELEINRSFLSSQQLGWESTNPYPQPASENKSYNFSEDFVSLLVSISKMKLDNFFIGSPSSTWNTWRRLKVTISWNIVSITKKMKTEYSLCHCFIPPDFGQQSPLALIPHFTNTKLEPTFQLKKQSLLIKWYYLPTPPLGQDMTQSQFVSGV